MDVTDGEAELRRSSHAKLQIWLEDFSNRLKTRLDAVATEVQQVVGEMSAVELNVHNAYNSFRLLSTSQFIENRVHEEDDTEHSFSASPQRNVPRPATGIERSENEILPRYKDAVATAWKAFQRSGKNLNSTSARTSNRSRGEKGILPFIIGTEDFARDDTCGLGGLRTIDNCGDHFETDGDADIHSTGLTTDFIDTGGPAQDDPSRLDSLYFDHQDGSLEPAVSAALDFKAMLEAALRNPSLPYDGGADESSADGAFGIYDIDEYSLNHSVNQTLSDSPRTISTMVDIIGRTMSTMEERKDEILAAPSQQPPVGETLPLHSTDVASDIPFRYFLKEDPAALRPETSGANEEDLAKLTTFEELVTQSFHHQTQSLINVEIKQYLGSNSGSKQVATSKLNGISSISGGLFEDENSDTQSLRREEAPVPNSNTGPTVPHDLFQNTTASEVSQQRSTDSLDSSQLLQPLHTGAGSSTAPIKSTNSALDYVSNLVDTKASLMPEAKTPSKAKWSVPSVESSDLSQITKAILSRQAGSFTHKGLFDDDDEDEDSSSLFGRVAPKAVGPSFRSWAPSSSKSLFDGMKQTDVEDTTVISPKPESKHEEFICKVSPSSIPQDFASLSTSDPPRQPHDEMDSPVESTKSKLVDSLFTIEHFSDKSRGGKQITNVASMTSAVLQHSMPTGIPSDEDSWSNSENEEEVLHDQAQTVLLDPHDSPPERLEANEAKELRNGHDTKNFDGQVAVFGQEGRSSKQSFTANAPANFIELEHEGSPSDVALQEDQEAANVQRSSTTSRSISGEKTSQISRGTADSELGQSPAFGRDPHLQSIAQRQIMTSTSFQSLEPSEYHGPSVLEPIASSKVAGVPAQIPAKAISQGTESVSKSVTSNDQTLAGSEFERLSRGRVIASLFEDDDAEDSLFGRDFPKPENVRQLIPEPRTSSGTKIDISLPAPTKGLDSSSLFPVLQKKTSESSRSDPVQTQSSNSSPSKSGPGRKAKSQSGLKSDSKISALLGDDGEEDEDALFGPLGGQGKWGKTRRGAEKNASSSGLSPPGTSSRSLFGD